MSKWGGALQGLDDVMLAAIRLSAMRLDTSVDAAGFVDELDQLLERTYEAGYRAGQATAAAPGDSLPPAKDDAAERDESDPVGQAMRALRAAAEPASDSLRRPQEGERRCRKLSYDDKVRIQSRHDAACEENGGRAPRGFIDGLAAEYGVSKQRIHQVIKGD